MRHIAKSMGFEMNEYGLFQEDGKLISCKDEEELFNRLGMAYIPLNYVRIWARLKQLWRTGCPIW